MSAGADHPSWCKCRSCTKREIAEERAALAGLPDSSVEAELGPPPGPVPDDGFDHYDPADATIRAMTRPGRSTREEDPYEGAMERYRFPGEGIAP